MTTPCIGRINTILTGGDRRITHAEYCALEQAVFADGIAEELEVALLAPVLDRRAGYRFADATDALRLRTLMEGRAFNWTLYRTALQQKNLTPCMSDVEQSTLQRNGYADQRAEVLAVTQPTADAWRVALRKQGKTFTWPYHGEGVALAELTRSWRGVSIGEIFLSLVDGRATVSAPFRTRVNDVISAIARGLRDAPHAREDYRAYYNAGRRFADDMQERVAQETVTHPVHIGAYPFFAGDAPRPEVRVALAAAMDRLCAACPTLYDLMIDNGFLVDCYSWERLTRLTTDFDAPPRPTGGYSPDIHVTQVNIDLDPQAAAFVLIHEIGHFIVRLFRSAREDFDAENVEDVLAHYFTHLQQLSATAQANHFARRYSATAEYEWFPDAFAISVLGDTPLAFRASLHAAISGQAIGYAELLRDFRTRDPIGAALIDDVLAMLSHPLPWPTHALTSPRLGELLRDADEGTFLADKRALLDRLPLGVLDAATLQQLDDLLAHHLYDRELRAAFYTLLTRSDLSPALRGHGADLAQRLFAMLPDDDELARIRARSLQRIGDDVGAYRVLTHFKRRTHIDMDSVQSEIAETALLRVDTAPARRNFFYTQAGPLLIERLTGYAERAARPLRKPHARPGRPAAPQIDTRQNDLHTFLALDRVVPTPLVQRYRTTQNGRLLHAAMQQLIARCAADHTVPPSVLATWRAKY